MADEHQVQEETQQETQESAPDFTAEDLRLMLDDAIAEYGARQDLAESNYAQSLSDFQTSLSGEIDGLSTRVEKLAAASEDSKGDASTVVVIDGEQWATMQKCWGWCKAGAQVAIFLELVLLLMVCALFGNRLWEAFSKGWRS